MVNFSANFYNRNVQQRVSILFIYSNLCGYYYLCIINRGKISIFAVVVVANIIRTYEVRPLCLEVGPSYLLAQQIYLWRLKTVKWRVLLVIHRSRWWPPTPVWTNHQFLAFCNQKFCFVKIGLTNQVTTIGINKARGCHTIMRLFNLFCMDILEF